MKQSLSYGRISWSYEDQQQSESFDSPTPLVQFSPIRINGKLRTPNISDRTLLALIKYKTENQHPFRDLYREWFINEAFIDRDLGEGRSFHRWLQLQQKSIIWKPHDIKLHPYFTDEASPKHDVNDEMAKDLSFAIRPVEVSGRKIKLYLQDEAVLGLISLKFGEEEDFIELVSLYIRMRFKWETWQAPAPTFLDWVKAQAKRPKFQSGQLGFTQIIYAL
jgi:hypothetical protein